MSGQSDHYYMARALELARRGIASTAPNPAVGCIIVKHGEVIAEGFTQRAGGNHAEIEALLRAGPRAAGATVYVSLEPCAHTGRTGPCASALIRARVARVVYAVEDPNPAVAGKGVRALAEAGVEVEGRVLAAAAEEINRGFFARMRRRRPWIRCKLAASLDGRTALANGESQWITGAPARRDSHRWRARSSAVMTGIGTVLADDPRLSARIENPTIDIVQPVRVIVDSGLRTPSAARLFDDAAAVWIFTGPGAAGPGSSRRAALEAAGARVETVTAEPRCDLWQIATRLAELEINDVWLESGPTLAGAMAAAGLIDEFVFYFAPSVLGADARGLFALPPLETLDDRLELAIDDVRRIGDDLRIVAFPRRT